MNKMTTWKTLREELNLTEEDEKVIALEKKLIETMDGRVSERRTGKVYGN